jgi:hypothetical protein
MSRNDIYAPDSPRVPRSSPYSFSSATLARTVCDDDAAKRTVQGGLMLVRCVRRESTVGTWRLVAGAASLCLLLTVFLAGASTSRAAGSRAYASGHVRRERASKASSEWTECVRAARKRSWHSASEACKALRKERKASHGGKPTGSSPPVGGQSSESGTTPGTGEVLEEPPPVSVPEQPSLPGTPPAEVPPVEKAPTEVPAEKPTEKAVEEPPAPFRFFAPTSFWNEPVPASAPLDPSSAAIVAALNEEELEEQSGAGAAINTTSWSVPIYIVPADQSTVRVTLAGSTPSAALQAAWAAVPLPSDAQPANGTDKHLVVWQPSTNRMWEFWRLERIAGSWSASWGGAMHNVTADKGVYGPEAWSGAATNWGASASSLPIAGGLITLEDLERGEINHALAISVPNTRYGAFASPAQRTDGGSTHASSLPEGAHLRLDPSLNLAGLHLPPFTLMLAKAAQRYGIFVRDTASNIALYGQDPIPTGKEPYGGSHGYYEGKSPAQLLAAFPWSHLELLKMELHATS